MNKDVAIIGYSGHGIFVIDSLQSMGRTIAAYCDQEEKAFNPFQLRYLGSERLPEVVEELKKYDYFITVGENSIREKVYNALFPKLGDPITVIHQTAYISPTVEMGPGVLVAARATITPLVKIGKGVICSTGADIDHECEVGDFTHVSAHAVLCGNVKVGKRSFIGANSVVRQGLTVGDDVIIGAGSVVVKDVPSGSILVGNPAIPIRRK